MMTARKCVFLFAMAFVGLLHSAPMTSEIVWLKEVTTRSQTDKRTHSDTNLPNELAFVLRRVSETLSLRLRRNHDINPKADFYFAQNLNDGESALVKSPYWETEDVAYYQDMENSAFFTVRCVKQSNAQCENIINGHIRIRNTTYELIPAENDAKSRNLLDFTGSLGTKYLLRKQSFTQGDDSSEVKGAAHLDEEDIKQELKSLFRRFERQDKEHQIPPTVYEMSTRHISDLYDREATDVIRQQRKEYTVKVAVMIDLGLWDFYSSMVPEINEFVKRRKVKAKIRQSFSYIMNGVSLLYRGIETNDASISIRIILTDFIVFRTVHAFPHQHSKTLVINGTKYIAANKYLRDLELWDRREGLKNPKVFDNGMLFTRFKMYYCSIDKYKHGTTYPAGVCSPGLRMTLVEARGLFWTVFTAAHELGHNLGAVHDGDEDAEDCKSEDNYIMSSKSPVSSTIVSSKNPWSFSKCSVELFKHTLKRKNCVLVPGSHYDLDEYNQHLKIEAGVAYNSSEQCRLLIGRYSKLCETPLENVCHAMRCTFPATGRCMTTRHGAADGTECGHNKRCVEARCVPRI